MGDSLGRILIVDDEPSVIEVLSEYFTSQGYVVATAGNGEEALRTVPSFRPAVVLLDVRMPGLDGVEVLKRIRAVDEHVSVIMVTANEDVALARETLKIGAFDYVAKPFDLSYLDQAVSLGLIQSSGGAESRTGSAPAPRPGDVWKILVLATFCAVRAMVESGRQSPGMHLESAALGAAREATAGRAIAAGEWLREIDMLLGIAGELGDITPTLRQPVEAAIAAARAALSAAG
jgi:DNA-binding response OmpR family regulator